MEFTWGLLILCFAIPVWGLGGGGCFDHCSSVPGGQAQIIHESCFALSPAGPNLSTPHHL